MDLFDDLAEDGELTDTEIDYGNQSDSENEEDHGEESESDGGDQSDDDVRRALPRKQKFKNLNEVMDESNYDPLPQQADATYTWNPSANDDESKPYTWTTNFFRQGRVPRNNLIGNHPGPSREGKQCTAVKQLFDRFITAEMINRIVRFMNQKIAKIVAEHPHWQRSRKYTSTYTKPTDAVEIPALFGLMYTRAVTRQNLVSVKQLFQHIYANPVFKSIMSKNRFVFLMGIIQFDDLESREERWESDRFAAIRQFFNEFNDHCARMRVPSDLLSLDETLYPFRGRIGIKQYNPNKPAKYGLLYRSISDAKLPYTYNTLPYAGKPNVITQERVCYRHR